MQFSGPSTAKAGGSISEQFMLSVW